MYIGLPARNEDSRKFIAVRRREGITFHCLRKALGQINLSFPSFGFTLKVGDDSMVDIEKEKELIATHENFDLTSEGDGTVDKMFRVFIQSRSIN